MTKFELIGHAQEIKWLRRAVQGGRVFLLVGPDGVGKRTLVETLISELLGVERAALLKHPEMLFIQPQGAANSITIEQARSVRRFLSLTPIQSAMKFVIIDGAECLRMESANALLKTFEEPPSYAVVFLLTSSEGSVLPTIRSRCLKLRLHLVSDEALRLNLIKQGEAEYAVGKVLPLTCGRPGHALTLLKDAKKREMFEYLAGLAEKLLFAERYTRLMAVAKVEREQKNMLPKLPEIWMPPLRQRFFASTDERERERMLLFLRECERAADAMRNSALNAGLVLESIMMKVPGPA